jgi:hypothetical protein
MGWRGLDLSGSGKGKLAVSSEHKNEPFGLQNTFAESFLISRANIGFTKTIFPPGVG